MRKLSSGGGWRSIVYTWRMARRVGGPAALWRAMKTRNACKTCALGMGGQQGGMVDERGHFPAVCKKSIQAMAADMQGRIGREFFETYSIEEMRALTPRELEHMGRIAEPMYAGPGETHYRPISWDEALALCAERLKATPPDENVFYVSGRSSNEAGFLLQLFARVYGTNNINNCSYYCHQASGVALAGITGSGTATITLDDLELCDTFFLIGGNPASNHPRLMTALMRLRRRGGQLIVINPLRETGLVNFSVPSDPVSLFFGTKMATMYLQPHIGGDIALLTGIAKRVLELGAEDAAFLRDHTTGSEAWLESVRKTSWEEIEQGSGVARAAMESVADAYSFSRAAIFGWTMGITHHLHGVDNVRAIANLALLRGMAGRPGAGLLPIRGHSNVQGIGTVGVAPQLKEAVRNAIEARFGVKLPKSPGMDTLASVEAMQAGKIRNLWCLGGNLFGSNPDAGAMCGSFANTRTVTYLSTTLNTGHVHGTGQETLILPVRARDEEPQPTTQESMFNFVRLSDGGAARLDGPRAEIEIVADLAERVLGRSPIDWRDFRNHGEIRAAIAAIIPGLGPIAEIGQAGREFHVVGRVFHRQQFGTPDGKARVHVVSLPESPREGELRLMTIRSEGQFNTVVYEEQDIYRHQDRRDVILLSAHDIAHLGLRADQRVRIRSAVGELRNVLVREFGIRAGNAAVYYPEANVLVPRTADPESRTPAFKSVSITVRAEGAAAPAENTVPLRVSVPRERRIQAAC